MKAPLLADPRLWAWLAIALVIGGLLYVLSPILAPFLAGAILAYVLNPLVGRLTGRYLPRVAAVVLVLLFALALVVALAPWLKEKFAIDFQLDIDTVKQMAGGFLAGNQDMVTALLGSLKIGGMAVLTFAVNVLLVPVVLFFLLRDWNGLIARVDAM